MTSEGIRPCPSERNKLGMKSMVMVVAALGAVVIWAEKSTPPSGAASSCTSGYETIIAGPGSVEANEPGCSLDSRIRTSYASLCIPVNTYDPKGLCVIIR